MNPLLIHNERINAQCTVTRGGVGKEYGMTKWIVHAWGEAPYDYARIYVTDQPTEDDAAKWGLKEFEDDARQMGRRESKSSN